MEEKASLKYIYLFFHLWNMTFLKTSLDAPYVYRKHSFRISSNALGWKVVDWLIANSYSNQVRKFVPKTKLIVIRQNL